MTSELFNIVVAATKPVNDLALEVSALRVALARVEQDNRALQKALDRMQTDRDYWRDQCNKTRETK